MTFVGISDFLILRSDQLGLFVDLIDGKSQKQLDTQLYIKHVPIIYKLIREQLGYNLVVLF